MFDPKSKQYFIGIKKFDLSLKGQLIHVSLPNTSPSNSQEDIHIDTIDKM